MRHPAVRLVQVGGQADAGAEQRSDDEVNRSSKIIQRFVGGAVQRGHVVGDCGIREPPDTEVLYWK